MATGGNIRPAFLKIQNPLRVPDVFVRGREAVEVLLEWLSKHEIINRDDSELICRARSIRDAHRLMATAIEGAGFDGLVYENEHEGGTEAINEDSFVVLRTLQIRSVYALS